MNRREFLGKCGQMGVGAVLFSNRLFDVREGRRRPNFIVMMADDCSAKEFSCYGNTEHSTPNVDKLAQTGVRFKTCWCTPVCSPTRAEIMTGRYGFRTGWYHNNVKPASGEKGYILSDDNLIFAQVLKNAGYATAICGKWQLRGTQAEHGFDEHCMWKKTGAFDGPIEPPEGNLPGRAARYWHPAIVRNDVQLDTDDDDYGPNIFTDFALEFAEKHKDEPFLVYYPMVLPHLTWDFDLLVHGWVAPPEIDENDRWTGNKGEPTLKGNVEYIDYLVGRIVKGLEELGLRDNTIFMITGDNGTAGYGKSILYQEKGPRVTMVVNCPGTVEPIGASDALVDFTDIMATLVDISGARLPAGYVADGHSFAPILRNEKQHVREWIFSFFKDKRFLRDTRWLLDGDGTFWDTHGSRDEGLWGTVPYTDVTSSTDPEVVAAQAHFEQILQDLPAGPPA
ncbi:MAG: sulfatase-like hydrolase/transferase [Planctomycetota bacterium]|jgi:arylsulfatase A-like enzyme